MSLFTPAFTLICIASFASFTSFYFLLATLPVYLVKLGGSSSHVGLIIGIFSATAVGLRPFIGRSTDRHGKKIFLIAGAAIISVCSGIYGFAASLLSLFFIRIIHGAGWASFGTASAAYVADVVPHERRGEAMAYYGMFSNIAMAAGPALGVILMTNAGFGFLFASSSALAIISLVLSIRLPSPPVTASRPLTKASLIEKSAIFPSSILLFIAITYGSIVSFLPVYASTKGISNPGIFFTVYAITVLIGRSFTGIISDRRGRTFVIMPGLILAALGLLTLAFAQSTSAFLLSAFIYGLAFAAIQPSIMALVVDRAPRERRGAAMGTFSMAMDLGIGTGSFLWGFIADKAGFEKMYLASAGVAAFAALLFGLSAKRGETKNNSS
jgi:MFS family permease